MGSKAGDKVKPEVEWDPPNRPLSQCEELLHQKENNWLVGGRLLVVVVLVWAQPSHLAGEADQRKTAMRRVLELSC